MSQPSNRPVAISLQLYRALASAFPQEFQNVYGEELVQAAEDSIEPIWRRHGALGLVRLLVDIAFRLPAEHLAELRRDVRYGLRTLAASPGFTAVALISLSLGIAIATCSYSELNGLILRNLPGVPRPQELVALRVGTSYPNYRRYRELRDLFSSTAAYVAPVPFGVSFGGRTERSWGHLVTPTYFSTLGVHPALGRFFGAEEEQPGRAPTVVVSYRFWESHLGSDPSITGKTLRVNGHPCAVIGVGPRDFLGASPAIFVADLWLPISVGTTVAPELAGDALERRDLTMFQMLARLNPGVTEARAEAELDAVARQLAKAAGEPERREKGLSVLLVSGGKVLPMRKQDLPFFTNFFMIVAGLVLLIACSNVANMTLARATGRRREIAVRLALGASRARLVRLLLTESMLVAAGAGVLGFLLSAGIMRLASQERMPFPMPVHYDLNVDRRALLFTMAVTLITGVAFSLLPALRATRANLTPALKEGGNVPLRRSRRVSLRNLLLLAQVAASLMLLLLVGILALGIQSTMGMQAGFNPRNLYLVSVDPVREGYSEERAVDFFLKLRERVERLPAVTAACLTDTVPVAVNGSPWVSFSTAGETNQNTRLIHDAVRYVVGRNYFETTGIPILFGRSFRKEDESNDARTVIVSEQLAREIWPGKDPAGQTLTIEHGEAYAGLGGWPGSFDNRFGVLEAGRQVFEVVGVAGNVANNMVASKQHPAIYFPLRVADYARPSLRGVTLIVRGAPGGDVLGGVRHEISAMDPNLAPFNARSMLDHIAQFMFPLKVATWTYAIIGAFGLILASVGLAGVTAYSVAQRGHEIAIRMALGARAGDVLGLVMSEGAVLVSLGTLIGLAGAWAGMRLLTGIFTTVATMKTTDPVLIVGAPLLLAAVALAACYLPAQRSLRIDPATALRQE